MNTQEHSIPQASGEQLDEPEPIRPDITQAFQIADELVDTLWEDLLNAIRYRDNEAYNVAAKHLRESYFFMLDSMKAYKEGSFDETLSLTQEERIQEQIDICRKCHVRLQF